MAIQKKRKKEAASVYATCVVHAPIIAMEYTQALAAIRALGGVVIVTRYYNRVTEINYKVPATQRRHRAGRKERHTVKIG